MSANALIQSAKLGEALAALQGEIRRNPGDPKLRIFLFQLDCVLGDLEKGLAQLQVVAGIDADTMLLAQVFRSVIACELFRREVFSGERVPLIFGEPAEWIGQMVQANTLTATGKLEAAAELRSQAFDVAPASTGKVDSRPFEWIADADSRLGPLLEVVLEGKYYWIPFCRMLKIEIEKPTDLRDLVWLPARFTWTNGGTASGHIPTRYPGTEKSLDDVLRLARKTEWTEPAPGCFIGLGQRLLATDAEELPLLDCRIIEFSPGA